MSKKQKEQTITINEIEYNASDLTQDQVTMVNHVTDLDRKINSSQFNLDQLMFGKRAFMDELTKSLESAETIE